MAHAPNCDGTCAASAIPVPAAKGYLLAVTGVGAPGPQGEAGPIGPVGPVGPVGPEGPAGVAGPQGVKGDTGSEGPVGPAGPQGQTGLTGSQGVAGVAGPVGPAGVQGEVGPAGPKGDTGAASTVPGPQGVKGDTGSVGPAGPVGAPGADSTVPGPQGLTGPAGPQGPAGADSTVPGQKGDPGPAGADGAPGAKGDTGPAGPKGDTGDTGVAGADGDAGATGPQGEPGPAGATGAAGKDGVDGAVGPKGDTGAVGPAGVDGADGAVGPEGPTVVSADVGNYSKLGTDGKIFTPASGSDYTLPVATATKLGGVKVGTGLAVTADGTLSSAVAGNYLLKTGDAMTGPLRFSSTGTSTYNGTDVYVFWDGTYYRCVMPGGKQGWLIGTDGAMKFPNAVPNCAMSPTDTGDLTNKAYVDAAVSGATGFLKTTGGEMTGAITLPSGVNGLTIKGTSYNMLGGSGGVAYRNGTSNIINFTGGEVSAYVPITTPGTGVGVRFGSGGPSLSKSGTAIASSAPITVATAPATANELANKVYVDSAIAVSGVANPVAGSTSGLTLWTGSQSAYDAIATKDPKTVYMVV